MIGGKHIPLLESTKRNNTALQRRGTGQLVASCLQHLSVFSPLQSITSLLITTFVLKVLKTFATTHDSTFVMPTYTGQVIKGLPIEADKIHFYTTKLKEKYSTHPQLYCNNQVITETLTSSHHLDCILYTGLPIGDIHAFKPARMETLFA